MTKSYSQSNWQDVFRKIDYPMHLRKSVLATALETAHLNSKIKNMIVNKKLRADYVTEIRENLKIVKELLNKLESCYFSEIKHPEVSKIKKTREKAFKYDIPSKNSINYNLIREINEIKEKLARL